MAALLAVAAGAVHAGKDYSARIDYLYLDANEGQAAGGHAALRFGDEVYHFEYAEGGLIRAARQAFEPFRLLYTETENRTLHISRIAVTPDTYAALHQRFETRLERQNAQFEVPEALRRDREILEMLADATGAPPRLLVKGLGLFEPAQSNPPEDPALAELRARVLTRHGADGIRMRMDAVRQAISALRPDPPDDPLPADVHSSAPWRYRFADRYHDFHALLEAYRLLERAAPLRRDAYHAPPGREFALKPDEIDALQAFSRKLAESVLATLEHPRPDQGPGLLVALARLEALGKTLRYGRLVFLDTLKGREAAELPWRGAPPIFSAADADFRQARRELSNGRELDEVGYSLLENAANRRLDARKALAGRVPFRLRVPSGLMPARPGIPEEIVRPALGADEMRDAARGLRAAEAAHGERLAALYRYHLVNRNCVTEIFRTLDEGARPGVEGLGGRIEPMAANAIPFVSAQNVERRYRVVESFELASRRKRFLETLDSEAYLAELSPLSSAIYRPNDEDSLFLFFTDAPALARPLFGAANLATGGLETLAGIVTSPFDSGRTFYLGLRGMLVSLPELAFFNIRKGTFHRGGG
ncbi:serine/threonine-protein kinase [Methylococcus geothermalis]|uniref:DUF4105 domain-containing protein n=1 Tax=Methylococcus geothermalis TaxID=2681310 RepID=A0A858QAK8_9GAMM|nr:hypothetical protein [Methylococcus geothermalis]QJD30870.1 hypothetical protein GNH96_13440 [Methylococcus geothermalis]